jgi:hypothetical protein
MRSIAKVTSSVAFTASLPVEVLMKSAPRHHADHRGLGDIAQSLEIAGGEDRLHMRIAASGAEIAHLVIKRLPVLGQRIFARDDDVDLPGAIGDRGSISLSFTSCGTRPGRKAGRDGGNRNVGTLQSLDGGRDITMIDANGAGGEWRSAMPSASRRSGRTG